MKSQMKLLIVSICAAILTGCMGYRHSRDFVTEHPDGRKDRQKESTSLGTLFKKGEAAVISSETIHDTNGYSRTVGATSVKGSVDAKGVTAAGGAIGEAGKTFVKP